MCELLLLLQELHDVDRLVADTMDLANAGTHLLDLADELHHLHRHALVLLQIETTTVMRNSEQYEKALLISIETISSSNGITLKLAEWMVTSPRTFSSRKH